MLSYSDGEKIRLTGNLSISVHGVEVLVKQALRSELLLKKKFLVNFIKGTRSVKSSIRVC